MRFTPHGKHLIAGDWIATDARFSSEPAHGPAHEFGVGTVELVDRAACAAQAAFPVFSTVSRAQRADFLDTIADEIEARAAAITQIATQETGLPEARLNAERGRTTGQLRLFADHIRKGDYLDRRFDPALPDRAPVPRPDMRMMQLPLGPVAVFGASNFPLAFSTAGGDTASALAAGCPVVVKGHSAHPGTGEIIAEAVLAAIKAADMPRGVFSLVQGGRRDVGTALVTHPLIKAVGFTGSLAGGRALFDLCAQRAEPIAFFGELGSVNPMFILPEAGAARAAQIGAGWAASLTMGAGQFCTNPGIAVVAQEQAQALAEATAQALGATGAQTMLTDGIAQAYRTGRARVAAGRGVQEVLTSTCDLRQATPYLYRVCATDWLADHSLSEEVFGPLGVIVTVENPAQMVAVAQSLQGQLTCTLHLDAGDTETARGLLAILQHKAGRILANGFPTGVEVCDTMVHGGPYPASTNFGATSVGTMAIRRFLRPVCFQNLPAEILPPDLA
ncbi:Alpha-ketoglutaric semialdehyde dehydrogenase [Aquimixticola soesokkakensis]|uniref:Alpha-ketoglutaric semialdehyde dehydrogenase n=1 Tax=Aquimixticola soesokkakensis TaxID=1519096 RepID=A0A1Y5RQE7_9RHOB|nr:aldehyde dehydrogenase (NADP(+)) [Aquimixticola soesokkakensis]SLN22872.1 Alpha-ketoglutaric semialdehyde dehydrogenase [Aquimixticola soesokkakensis]